MSAGTGCCGGWSWCPFWTGPGPRGRWNGCPRSFPLLPRPPSGPGTEPSGRRQRALAAWTSAAGSGLVAWGLGTKAPTRAEAQQNIELQKDLLRERGIRCRLPPHRRRPVSDRGTPSFTLLSRSWDGRRRAAGPAQPAAAHGARVANEAPTTWTCVLRVLLAAQRRRGRRSPPAQPWSRPERWPGCGQQRLNHCRTSRPAAATGPFELTASVPPGPPAASRRHHPDARSSVWVRKVTGRAIRPMVWRLAS
jgi:hypothetical protein